MFLEGHVDHWQATLDFGKQSITEVNRKIITEFTHMCLEHMMYMMVNSFYLNLSWSVNVAYQSFKFILPEDVRAKLCTSTSNTHPTMLEFFHPCQLEKKYGGTAESPVNYWPPYVGKYFVPEN